MGISERKEREREQRRSDIIDAAERVIFSKHLDASTMDEIAEEAELSKGTLYLYFRNKTELYLAIQDRGLSILSQRFHEVLAASVSVNGLQTVRALGKAYFDFSQSYPNYFNADVYGRSQEFLDEVKALEMNQAIEARRMKLMSYFSKAIQAGIDDGSIRAEINPDRTALQLYAAFHGIIQVYMNRRRSVLESIMDNMAVNKEPIVDEFFDLVQRGLKG
jgi:TetR/AcrR family transcriptional regulator